MIHKLPSPKADCVRVIFELPACIWADRIFLVGDFNDWSKTVAPFAQGRDGVWRVTLDLTAGREYQFRYLVDGRWQTDFHADGWVDNEFGSKNSIVEAVLPPGAVPVPGPTSLLHEGLRESGPTRQTQPFRAVAPSRYFPTSTRAAS